MEHKRLYGFHRAKLGGAPLFIFEGYADVTTAHMYGLSNSVAVSSAGTTTDQLELILRYKIPHVILCLDADEGGWKGIKTFVDTLERVKPPSWFLAEIMYIPAGEDDPDAYIRKYGVEAFKNLPRIDVFSWKVNHLVKTLASRQDLFNRLIQFVLMEPSPWKKFQMAITVSRYLQIPPQVIYDEALFRSGKHHSPEPLQKPIKLIDCGVSPPNSQPDLVDDLIAYPRSFLTDF
jgi:DNA primase